MESIKLAELSKKSGKTELAIAKTIITFLAIKAEVTGVTQTIVFSCPKEGK